MRRKKRTQKLLIFQRNQSRHPSKWRSPRKPKKAQEGQVVQEAQKAEATKEAYEVKL